MRIKNSIGGQVHLMTVPNNNEGKRRIKIIRDGIKASGTKISIVLYGRGCRFGKGRIRQTNNVVTNWDNSYQSHVPLDKAQKIAVYIMGRRNRTA